MRANEFENLFQCIPALEAQEILLQLTVADFPMMKAAQRKKKHEQISKIARAGLDKQEPMSFKKLAAIIGSAGATGNGNQR